MKPIIRTILYEWKEKLLPEILPRKADLHSYLDIKPSKIIVVTGFRRTGKTYLVYDLIKDLIKKGKSKEEIIYFNFEDERIPLKTEFLTLLLPTIRKEIPGKIKYLFLDEIQNIPNWSKWLRRIYDNKKINNIFVTGSNSKLSSREIPTELRGRCLEILVYPLSFKEFLVFKKIKINVKIAKYSENEKIKITRALKEYLEYGGLPEIVLLPKEKKLETAQSYYKTVLQRDIIERFDIKNEEALKAMLRLLLNSISYSISKLHNNLKSSHYTIAKYTLQQYLSYVENSYFMYSLPVFSYKIKNQLQHPRKVYFIDNVFITSLSTKHIKDFGRLFENQVMIELLRRHGKENLFYWKDYHYHYEVDFVIKEGFEVKQLIQVCYDLNNDDTKKREMRALIRASKELKCDNLLVITEDHEGEEKIKGKKISYVPLWKWLLG